MVKLQGWFRAVLARKSYMDQLRALLRLTGEEDLLMTNDEIERRDKGKVIFKHMCAYWQMRKRQRRREAATLKIQTFYRMRFVKNSSFISALQLARFPKIYFLKEQKPQFMKILKKLVGTFEKQHMSLADAFDCISEDQRYDTIRIEEPDLFQFKPLPLLQFIMPSFGRKTLIRENKNLGLDRAPMPALSLNQFYAMRNPQSTLHHLKTLQKRNCRFSHQKLRVIFQQRQEKTATNQMVFFDKYNDLLVFECRQLRIVVQVLFAILDYNRQLSGSEDQQFLCFFEPLLNKVAAVTKFQQAVRACLYRNKVPNDQLPVNQIIQKRAAYCIQAWWHGLKLRKRLASLANIQHHLAKINSCDLYLD